MRVALKFCWANGAPYAQLLGTVWPGQFRSRSCDVRRGTTSDWFSTEIVIYAACLIVIELNGEMRYLGQARTASDFSHRILALQRPRWSLTLTVQYLLGGSDLCNFCFENACSQPLSDAFLTLITMSSRNWHFLKKIATPPTFVLKR